MRDGRRPPGVRRAREPEADRRGALAGAAQIALCLAFVQWHAFARFLVGGRPEEAIGHAEAVVRWERAAGLDVEGSLQALAVRTPMLATLFRLVYSAGHVVAPVAALTFLWRRDRVRFRSWRNTLGLTAALAIPVFWLWPMAPPRFMPGPERLLDLNAATPWDLDLGRPIAPALFNGFAAMPSLHCAFAIWVALATVPMIRSRPARVAITAYPVVMTVATVVTGNHFLLDAVGAAAALLVARLVVVAAETAGGRAVHAPELVARRAQVALAGAILVIWLPRGRWVTVAGVLLVLGIVEAVRQHHQSLHGGQDGQGAAVEGVPETS